MVDSSHPFSGKKVTFVQWWAVRACKACRAGLTLACLMQKFILVFYILFYNKYLFFNKFYCIYFTVTALSLTQTGWMLSFRSVGTAAASFF